MRSDIMTNRSARDLRPAPRQPLAVKQVVHHSGVVVLAAAGDIDTVSVRLLQRHLGRKPPPDRMILDLTEVGFLAVEGLRALLSAGERAASEGREFGVVAPTDPIRRIFRITGVADRLRHFEDVTEALSVTGARLS
jgi:anti-anti-sigma factor